MYLKVISSTVVVLIVVLAVASCGGKGSHRTHYTPESTIPIKTIAVLPMVNNSIDVDAPAKVRQLFYNKIQAYRYQVKPLTETDDILNLQMGITLGKQLAYTTPQKLGEMLNVEGVFYGFLLDYDETVSGVYNVHKVRMGWKLVSTKTGEVLWGRGIAVKSETGGGGVGAVASLASRINDADEEIRNLPVSTDPLHEMPGLDHWVFMTRKKSRTDRAVDSVASRALGKYGFASALVSSLGNEVREGANGTRLKQETDHALHRLFSHMLKGNGG
jgi:hypothetical protein